MGFIQGEIYHVYNRGNNRDPIFFEKDNYEFFLQKAKKELLPFCDILAYCLMPNHYHFLLFVKPQKNGWENKGMNQLSRKLGTLQSSYTRAINKRFNRVGSLFQARLKKKPATDYAFICFHYIHQNPLQLGLCKKLEDWEFSSFREYIDVGRSGFLNKELAQDLLSIPVDPELFYEESVGIINSERLSYLS